MTTEAAYRKRVWHTGAVRGLLFASPWLVGFVCLQAIPIGASAYYSLTSFNLFQSPKFLGLANYRQLASDHLFAQSIENTLYITVIGVPISLFVALISALAMNMPIRGQRLLRALVYVPTVIPVVAATYIWRWLLNGQYGYINLLIGKFKLPPPLWLDDPHWTKPALIMMGTWVTGASAIIFLAALKEIPTMYYEAASVDGAGAWRKFRDITLPSISPVILFQLIVGIIFSMQYFTQVFLLGQNRLNQPSGGPDNSMLMYSLYLFEHAFVYLDMGIASAMAWILFLIILALTGLLLLSSRKWVHYAGQ
jgi:multiple sugar transport system permease protein